ncbi:hypothetical protein [Thermococcus sp.]
MDEILSEELWRTVPIFILAFMTYAFIWGASGEKLPAVLGPIVSLILSLGTLPLRVWYRRRRYEG